ncbi:MAG: hypothetical protein OKBPIBMD_01926 [Chlorobi bacterium]|nr:hypothetical protein [Chlorobiota bacterium]MCL4277696.1 ATP-dependent Clp protease proteolytic subunit [Ignavibacteria bacterium]QOJ26639.1 MAG: ATP-dependent Clp protease proteolytic subunit [Ignavibacteria bacterium]
MNACHGLATKKETGLDLILHTPGGSIGATEAIVHYLRQMFGCNIRVIVPQIAMSAGTMIALASKEIILGKQSSLGPIDPQFNGIPANLIIKEFTQAQQELSQDPSRTPYWQIRLAKYPATWFYQAELAVRRAKENVRQWLLSNMFEGRGPDADTMVNHIVTQLSDSDANMAHDRHIHIAELLELGICVTLMEDDQELQDLILAVHHSTCLTLSNTNVYRIIENHEGRVNVLSHG